MSGHTSEPWKFESEENPLDHEMDFFITDAAGINQVCKVDISEANARRIVACVNACAGLPQDALDGGWTAAGMSDYAKTLEEQKSDLLLALKHIVHNIKAKKHGQKYGLAVDHAEQVIEEIEASK